MKYLKALTMAVTIFLLSSPLLGAPCDLSGTGSNNLQKAANSLEARQWCELTPEMLNFTERANDVKDIFDSCGDGYVVASFTNKMAYDPSQGTGGRFHWFGGDHGGNFRSIVYDIGTNTFSVGPSPSNADAQCGAGTRGKCQTDWENEPTEMCASCDAEHAYDGNISDNRGNFYYGDFQDSHISKVTLPSTQIERWKDMGSDTHTAAMAFWPDYGPQGTLVALAGGIGAPELIRFYDFKTDQWSSPFPLVSWDVPSGGVHPLMLYNNGSGEIWLAGGGCCQDPTSRDSYRIYLDAGTPKRVQLKDAPPHLLGIMEGKCIDDPVHPSGKFICLDLSEDGPGTSNAGWHEFDMGRDAWNSFAGLGIHSMPPIKVPEGYQAAAITPVSVPNLGVTVWLSHADDDGSDRGGFFVYKHTTFTGDMTPPAAPRNLEVQ